MRKSTLIISTLVAIATTSAFADEWRSATLKSEITATEPLKGIVLWPDNDKMDELKDAISLEFSYCLPCKVVKGKKSDGTIEYDWSSFEELLNDIKSRGHQAIVRFRYEYPGKDGTIKDAPYCTCNVAGATAVPKYIKEGSYGYSNPEYYKTVKGDGVTYYSDWTNSELKWFTKQFYTDFAAKYDNDPRIAYLQVGFGHWSEYHIYDDNGLPNNWKGKYFPDDAYQKEFFEHMSSVMKETPWSVSIDAADDSYTPIAGDNKMKALNFGLFDDSFMHSEHDKNQGDGYNEDCWINLGTDRWKTAPAGGEISYYTDNDQKNFLSPSGIYGLTWEQAAAKYHMSYVIGNDAPTGKYATKARLNEAGMNSGYSFEITRYQLKDNAAYVVVKNNGIAPIYHNAYVTVKGVRSNTSLKGLLPQETTECMVTGINIAAAETPEVTITSDKILEGKNIAYKADLNGTESIVIPTSVNDAETNNLIIRDGNMLRFAGSGYKASIISTVGQTISTATTDYDISNLPNGIYIIKYINKDKIQVKKIIK